MSAGFVTLLRLQNAGAPDWAQSREDGNGLHEWGRGLSAGEGHKEAQCGKARPNDFNHG
jgi:hypothetical protein